MRYRPRDARRRALLLPLALAAFGCIISRGVQITSVHPAAGDSVRVRHPVKAHLADGSTVLFAPDVLIARDTARGQGRRFDLGRSTSTPVTRVPLDSVVAMESFQTRVDAGRSVIYSTLAYVGTGGALVGLYCLADPKCFGSCPTIYAVGPDGVAGDSLALEAEGFSMSVSPLLETRDVDRLRSQPDSAGRLRLEVWNEALETHYINHLELLEVRHAPDEWALPDSRGRPLGLKPGGRCGSRSGTPCAPRSRRGSSRCGRRSARS